jgi:hypothetical protein
LDVLLTASKTLKLYLLPLFKTKLKKMLLDVLLFLIVFIYVTILGFVIVNVKNGTNVEPNFTQCKADQFLCRSNIFISITYMHRGTIFRKRTEYS